MGLSFGYRDCRETPAWISGWWGGKEGGKAGNTSMDGINSALWVLRQFWRWGWERKVNSVECFAVATQYQVFYRYIWGNFIILLQILWKKKLANYIIIAKETDFWLPKQACMIVLLISCSSFPLWSYMLSFPSFFCLFVWIGVFLVIVTALTNSGKNSWLPALCSGGFEMLKCWCGVCAINCFWYFQFPFLVVPILGRAACPEGLQETGKFAVS